MSGPLATGLRAPLLFELSATEGRILASAVSAADEPGGAELCSLAPADWSALP